ncbi:hypothetical protein EV143_12020 [Flavobacterium chryseum]|uniref:hypothetical protein n=1 Tax=Flavobacterium sp. P3160 TaxID=2512113 RepID=UPI00105C593B|nr:hypothetical protein [Flavobacterium sp. P3160]TDO68758.1 hypothetical protein EV143_12020 [Flavobacterium sp. P3160]
MITKSENHSHFWVENKILYESSNTIRGLRYRRIIELWFHYPDNNKLTDMMIAYVNRRIKAEPDKIINSLNDLPQQDQLSLF